MFSRLRPYAQLVRLPNVFTALADIALGTLALEALGRLPDKAGLVCLLLFLASACLYSGGMVWNDYFDLEQDKRERPFRPIPSGVVPRAVAGRLGIALLAVGFGCAALAGLSSATMNFTPAVVAGLLIAAIFMYDAWLKRFWAGPLGMGLCRFLNVLLGFSAAGLSGLALYTALVVGIYIVGVTWFARTEARLSERTALTEASLVMLLALVLALPVPVFASEDTASSLFPYMLVGLGFWLGIPVLQAWRQPVPGRVQIAVKRAIFGLVVLDATLAAALAGAIGLLILVLLLPALYLGRWIYST